MRLSDAAKHYKELVWVECHIMGVTPLEGRVAVEIEAFMARTNTDLDHCQKALLDALQGYAFDNDRDVWQITARKHIDRKNPRIEVRITEL
jgi:Holliday junction resolvase RusA-like endonuclease